MSSRNRSAISVIAIVAFLVSLLSGVTSGAAQAVGEDSGGAFVPVVPTRIVSTDTGVGGSSSPFGSGTTRSYTVLGTASVPTTGVSAVVVNVAVLHATSSSASSALTVWPGGETRPTAVTMRFDEDNSPRSNTTIVKVGSNGKVSVFNESGSVDVNLDITGYFTSTSDLNSSGGFVPITPTRVADTMSGQGVPLAKLHMGSSVDVQVSNDDEIPADATAVFANIETRSAKSGTMKIVPTGQSATSAPPTVKYQDSGPTSSGVMLKLSSAGKINVSNQADAYGGDVDFKIDIQGYFSGHSDEGGSYAPLTATTVYASTATGSTPLASGETRTLQVAGLAGIPNDATAGAVAVSLTVRNWTSSGTFTAYSGDDLAPPETTNLSFTAGQGEPSIGSETTAIVPLPPEGTIKVRNTSAGQLTFYVSAQGWFTQYDEPYVDDVTEEDFGVTPNPDLQVIDQAPEGADATLDFTPPVDGTFQLSDQADGTVKMIRGGQADGSYTPVAVDAAGNELDTELEQSGSTLTQVVHPTAETEYPVFVLPAFNAAESSTNVDDIYPSEADFFAEVDPVEVVDEGTATFVEELKTEPMGSGDAGMSAFAASSSSSYHYVHVPKKAAQERYYYYDPYGKHQYRSPWPHGWHDYCTKSSDAPLINSFQVSFKGPCARHDLCIEFKLGPQRSSCDGWLKRDIKSNCYYYFHDRSFATERGQCYHKANTYYAAVKSWTAAKGGGWGHSGSSSYPRVSGEYE